MNWIPEIHQEDESLMYSKVTRGQEGGACVLGCCCGVFLLLFGLVV